MNLFFAPPSRGWLLVRPASHAALFLSCEGQWTDTAGEARIFDSKITATHAGRTRPGSSVISTELAQWLRPPLMRVESTMVTR